MLKSNSLPQEPSQKATTKILFIITGSIACYKVCHVISQLKKNNVDVKVVATASALKFIGVSTLEGLINEKIYSNLYESGSNMDHIHLVRWADLIVVAPATANSINKMANGIADDLASTLFLAHDFQKPFLVFPAMNTKMYLHPVTQKSITSLKEMGIQVHDSASGVLACGETGLGRLLEPELILSEIEKAQQTLSISLNPKNEKQPPKISTVFKILITGGGTQEPIDDVRVISNKSTGKTASQIVDFFIENGFEVTYLKAKSAAQTQFRCSTQLYETFEDLQKLILHEAQNKYHMIIHLAAVSDYSVQSQVGKISSDSENLQLLLKKNPKLINRFKELFPGAVIVGFKLTSTTNPTEQNTKIRTLLSDSKCDYVVHNDWNDIKNGNHQFQIVSKESKTSPLTIDDLKIELLQLALLQNQKVEGVHT